jgi:hypothetical protein
MAHEARRGFPAFLQSRLQRDHIAATLGGGTFVHDACARISGDKAFAATEQELIATLDLLVDLDADAEMFAAYTLHALQQSGIAMPEADSKRLGTEFAT